MCHLHQIHPDILCNLNADCTHISSHHVGTLDILNNSILVFLILMSLLLTFLGGTDASLSCNPNINCNINVHDNDDIHCF